VRAILIPLALAALLAAACGRHESPPQPSVAAKVIGVPPAPPSGDTPFTQPVASGVNEMAKPVEVATMPLTGQSNDHETLAILNSERSEAIDVLKDPELARIANSDQALEIWRQKKLLEMQVAEQQRRKQKQAQK
jgi:hypothetical protein